jgi:ribonuclease HI
LVPCQSGDFNHFGEGTNTEHYKKMKRRILGRAFHTDCIQQKYYAVRVGRNTGIFSTWAECHEQVKSFSNAEFKSFNSRNEAENYLKEIGEVSIQNQYESTQANLQSDCFLKRRIAGRSSIEERKRKQMEYQSDESLQKYDYIVAFTDGSCLGNGQSDAVAGIGVFFGFNDYRNISEPFLNTCNGKYKLTNQRAEIGAVIACLQQSIASHEHVRILTDSHYLIKAMTEWRWTWEINGWKTASGGEIINEDLFLVLCDIVDSREGSIRFEYVAGHSGIEGNEQADKLAVSGASQHLWKQH